MRVLLDEMLPAGVAALLPDHEVTTVRHAGLKGLPNGELLRRAVSRGYEVFLTADRNLPSQQNISAAGIGIVLVRGSRMADLAPQVARIQVAVSESRPGTVIRVEAG